MKNFVVKFICCVIGVDLWTKPADPCNTFTTSWGSAPRERWDYCRVVQCNRKSCGCRWYQISCGLLWSHTSWLASCPWYIVCRIEVFYIWKCFTFDFEFSYIHISRLWSLWHCNPEGQHQYLHWHGNLRYLIIREFSLDLVKYLYIKNTFWKHNVNSGQTGSYAIRIWFFLNLTLFRFDLVFDKYFCLLIHLFLPLTYQTYQCPYLISWCLSHQRFLSCTNRPISSASVSEFSHFTLPLVTCECNLHIDACVYNETNSDIPRKWMCNIAISDTEDETSIWDY